MTLTIVIPVYNAEKYLEKCIKSILKQRGDNCNILLIDDGSKDSSPAICDTYANKYDFIKVIHQSNKGVSSARNLGIDNVDSEYLFFMDADDLLTDNALEIIKDACEKHNDIQLFTFEYLTIDNNDSFLFETPHIEKGIYTRKDFVNAYYPVVKTLPYAPWRHVFKTSFLKDNNLKFDSSLVAAEDAYFYFQSSKLAQNIFYTNEKIIQYRLGQNYGKRKFLKPAYVRSIYTVAKNTFYQDEDYIANIIANQYPSNMLYIEKLEHKEDRLEALNSIDWSIMKASKGKFNKLFIVSYKILGFNLTMKLVNIIRKIKHRKDGIKI